MPPLSIFEENCVGNFSVLNVGSDVSSSHSTISVACTTKKGPISPLSLSSPPRKQCRRRVAFDGEVKIWPTIHHSEYSEEERRNTWLTTENMEEFKSERRVCLRLMDQNPQVDNDAHYFRGLEGKAKEGYKRKRFNMVDACMTVMEEQSDQADMGTNDPEAIARAYIASNMTCVEEARQRGIFDQSAASII